jgi:hypothetical protein
MAKPTSPPLRVRFTRVSPTRHRIEWGTRPPFAARELETRSTLLHDLVHFAVESEAGLRESFYGLLARGTGYEALTMELPPTAASEIATTERVVGALQGAWKRGLEPPRFVAAFAGYQQQLGEPMPAWLTIDLIERVARLLRSLEGAWCGTPFGQALELRFEY